MLKDEDANVRLAALHSITMSRDTDALPAVLALLQDPDRRVRRQSAAVLGRLGDSAAVGPLLAALSNPIDRILEHALIYALIEIDDRDGTQSGLQHDVPQVRRAALIALDQMDHGQLSKGQVAPLLDADYRPLQQAALEIIGQHGWAAETLPLLQQWLCEPNLPDQRREFLYDLLLSMSHQEVVQQFIAEQLTGKAIPLDKRLLLLDVIANHELQEPPASWQEPVAAAVASSNEQLVRQAIRSAVRLETEMFSDGLSDILEDAQCSPETRLAAAAALTRSEEVIDEPVFETLVEFCHPDNSVLDQLTAADALSRAQLANEQLATLLPSIVPEAGPLVLGTLLQAFEQDTPPELVSELIESLKRSTGLLSLSTAQLASVTEHCPLEVQDAAIPLFERIRVNSESTAQRLNELETKLVGGYGERGRTVFFGKKGACHACHRVHGEGGTVGPDLSQIGQVRTPRDLLEALLVPNVSFARGYEPFIIAMEDGTTHSGVISRRTEDALYLGNADGQEIRLAKSDIEEVLPSSISVMPQGLEQQLSVPELRDLIAFLRSLVK